MTLGIEVEQIRFCENCKKETTHYVYEDALELEYRCTNCNDTTQMIKSFF